MYHLSAQGVDERIINVCILIIVRACVCACMCVGGWVGVVRTEVYLYFGPVVC